MDCETTLRARLRNDTAPLHEELDRYMASASFEDRTQYTGFLRAQLRALSGITLAAPECRSDLQGDMIQALCTDMTLLAADWQALPDQRPVQATALHYVLLGSRMGAKILNRRREASTSAWVRRAGTYLQMPVEQGAWTALCQTLTRQSGCGAEAEAIVADARSIFEVFLTTARAEPALTATLDSERQNHVA
jgi:heme oxygenase (biliverdin-IX-beta and delta-forming)